ncbi:S8 family serine peptidase [Paenibacillaceae bacterium WGS1546]|uniref:S8 family serine peptidase n=1 Tax=Cohnella sp. WGS1546 TaxID=3366810 RepID=UPI00372D717A
MRRYKWLGVLFGLAVLTFAIPLLPPSWNPIHRAGPPPDAGQPRMSASGEAAYKKKTVLADIAATERLNRAQADRAVRQLLQDSGKTSGAQRLRALLKSHPEIVYAEWEGDGRTVRESKLDEGKSREAETVLSLVRKEARSRGRHSSSAFSLGGRRYFAVGERDGSGRSVVALVSADVVQAVEKHQRRNMRLIPYPHEGRYRTESVLPNTNKDTTVKTGEDNGNASHYSVDEIVVKFRAPLTDKQLLRLREELDLTVVRHTGRTYVFRSKNRDMAGLKAYFSGKWNPEFVEPHYLYLTNEVPAIVPNDTLYSQYQWNLPEIATETGWNFSKGNPEVVVAVLDTGVQLDHPDLKGRLVQGVNIVDPSSPPEDDVGHGTHVAGIVAAEVNNSEGVAGMTWYTKVMPVKVLDSTGAGSTYSVAEGIIWATDHGAQVINMSLGNYAEAQFLHDAIKYAHERGVVLVAASGNDNTERPGFPAAYPEVLAVAATDPGEARAEYSNYGDYIDVAAPGSSIPSTYPGSQYAALSGTSMASPHVAALVSLVRAANPALSNAEVMDVLRGTAKDLGTAGKDREFGYGQIDVLAALQSAGGDNVSLQLYPEQVRRELDRLPAHRP